MALMSCRLVTERPSTQARAHRAKLLFGLAALGAAAELHGDMTQAARLASLDAFRKVCLNMPDDAARFLSRAYILRLS